MSPIFMSLNSSRRLETLDSVAVHIYLNARGYPNRTSVHVQFPGSTVACDPTIATIHLEVCFQLPVIKHHRQPTAPGALPTTSRLIST